MTTPFRFTDAAAVSAFRVALSVAACVVNAPTVMRSFILALLCSGLAACDAKPSIGSEANGDPATGSGQARAVDAISVGRRSSDAAVRGAADALAAGRPWIATTTVAPALASPARRTPAAVLVAAAAAVGWEGWSEVERLLAAQPWLDTLGDGVARELLARAALGRDRDSAAAAHASRAVQAASDAHSRGMRRVLLARALDRAANADSAARMYAAAADELPALREWLALRAAGVTRDSSERRKLYASLQAPAPRARVAWTEALALERAGEREPAARAYAALGDRAAALRLRLGGEAGDETRLALRRELFALLGNASLDATDAARALELATIHFPTPTAQEELLAARAAVRAGNVPRAQRGFGAAGALLTPRDRYDYGITLARARRWREAREQLARVPGELAGLAAYHRARIAMQSGDAARARQELQDVSRAHASNANAATLALLLLADLQVDDGRDRDARATLRELVRQHPDHPRAGVAAFRAAIIAIAQGAHAAAASELDASAAKHPRGAEAQATRYWSGRAYEALGDRGAARARWADARTRDSLSYYALLARLRLGEPAWRPASGSATRAGDASGGSERSAAASARARIALLDSVGLDAESRFEADALVRGARESEETLREAAATLRAAGRTSASIDLGSALLERGARDADAYRLVFPLVQGERLAQEARAHGLEPALVAALVRQESSFNPAARSPAGARGLMQVMPDVGRQLARARGFPVWDPAILYDADASLALGTVHLATFLRQYDEPARALAAYNAGPSRVRRWERRPGASDPELFAERIPFDETRDYVRTVRRNAAVYRALYDW